MWLPGEDHSDTTGPKVVACLGVKNIEANIAGTERAKGEQRVRRLKRMGGTLPATGSSGSDFCLYPG